MRKNVMKKYKVEMSYNYILEAESPEQAERDAVKMFDEEAPRSDEMNWETAKEQL